MVDVDLLALAVKLQDAATAYVKAKRYGGVGHIHEAWRTLERCSDAYEAALPEWAREKA